MPILDNSRNRAATAFLALIVAAAGGTAYFVYSDDHSHATAVWKVPQKHAPNYCYFGIVQAPSEAWDVLGLKVPEGVPALAIVKVPFYEPPECLPGAKVMVDEKTAEPAPREHEAEAWAKLVVAAKAPAEAKPVEEPKEAAPMAESLGEPKEEPKGEPVMVDACATRLMMLPGGIETGPDEWVEPCGPDSVFEAWIVSHKDAPWRCACGASLDPKDPCEKLTGPTMADPKAEPKWLPATPADMGLGIGKHRGSCVPIPCGDWFGGAYQPKECCADECEGYACGIGKCGHSCGSCAQVIVDAGVNVRVRWDDGADAGVEIPEPWTAYSEERQCVGHQCVPMPGMDAALELDADQVVP